MQLCNYACVPQQDCCLDTRLFSLTVCEREEKRTHCPPLSIVVPPYAPQSVFVYNISHDSSRSPVFMLNNTHPCLSLCFAPWDPYLLAYAEEYKNVYLLDVRWELCCVISSLLDCVHAFVLCMCAVCCVLPGRQLCVAALYQ